MNTVEKYNRLEELKAFVIKNNRVMLEDIVQQFNVSPPTARRYAHLLVEDKDMFLKIRNGIMVKDKYDSVEYLFSEKLKINRDEKQLIAKTCASLISDNQSLLIDSGTTCYFFAREILSKKLKVVSTDLKISMELGTRKNISLCSIGGEVRSGYNSIGGDIAIQNLSKFNVEIAVMSADAIDIEYGITNAEMFEVPIKREIRNRAQKLILLADSSKFAKQNFCYVMPLKDVDMIITDSNIPEHIANEIKSLQIELLIV